MKPIITHFSDNDLYKFTTMNAIQKLYPRAMVKYRFFDRNNMVFPDGFAKALREQVDAMADLRLTEEEEAFIRERCYFFDPVYIDLLKGYRFDPREVHISQKEGRLYVEAEGFWYRTVLWEVPLMAIISELYFSFMGHRPVEVEERAAAKGRKMQALEANYSDFGTRRRFSLDVHDRVVKTLKDTSGDCFKGTSNVYLAMKYNLTPVGTHPHEWFMFHGASHGYRIANTKGLESWTQVYRGDLGIALTDTFTTQNFFENFTTEYGKLFDGVRWDSGDPITFTNKVLDYYQSNRIDPRTKTVVYSDSLDIKRVEEIKKHVDGRVLDVYGIGTFLTNDVGVAPLNMVIKLTHAKIKPDKEYIPTVKLSDVEGKHTGDESEIQLCMTSLGLDTPKKAEKREPVLESVL